MEKERLQREKKKSGIQYEIPVIIERVGEEEGTAHKKMESREHRSYLEAKPSYDDRLVTIHSV
jgi:hypothetical protein